MSTRMFGRVSYTGEVLQCHCASDAHNHCNSLAKFWVRQRSRNVHSFKVFEQRHTEITSIEL